MIKRIITALLIVSACYSLTTFNSGCAQIGAPTGGARDSLAPELVRSTPAIKATNFSGNKITLTFNEYVEVAEAQSNVLVSPLPKNTPSINFSLRTVTIRLKDTLLPNTTYSINFGNAIKDVNEGNIFRDFTYVFSTGSSIDSATLQGKLLLAETGLVDSTIAVVLYRTTDDSAVQKRRPDYMAKIKGDGIFRFTNLPKASFKIYALKDGDGNKFYNSKAELFAFHNESITVDGTADTSAKLTLYAYSEERQKDSKITPVLKPKPEKQLKMSYSLSGTQDLLSPLELSFNNPLRTWDTSKIILTDTNYNKITAVATLDSTSKILRYATSWKPGESYVLLVPAGAVEDSAGNKLAKNDTLRFSAKNEADYGRVVLRFKNYDPSKNQVLQLLSGNDIRYSFPLTAAEFSNKRLIPGEYTIRILNDDNKDGKWTTGNYSQKLQPEKAVTLSQKLGIRADWDNERDIEL